MTPRDVASVLRAEDLEVQLLEHPNLVVAWFDVDENRVPVFVIVPGPADPEPRYFVLVAPAATPKPIEQLEASTLRELIKASSEIELAKLVYQEPANQSFFAAVSECSIERYTGRKLRLRMEACARLARRIEAIQG